MKPPRSFTRNGVKWEPVAVAMYGVLREVVPLADTLDEDGEMWHGHRVLFAPQLSAALDGDQNSDGKGIDA